MTNAEAIPVKDQVLRCEDNLLQAMKASDVQALDRLLHDDLLFIVPGGQAITKHMDLEAHRAGKMVVNEITPQIENISLFGDTAIVVLTIETRGLMLDEPIAGSFRYIRVWKLFEDQWKVIGGSCTAL